MERKCNRCKVLKKDIDFKDEHSKNCNSCRLVANNAYSLKKSGKLPRYAEVQKLLEKAYNNGNFVCNVCEQEKPLECFGSHNHANKYNTSRVCKECNREVNKFSKYKKAYNISQERFIEMLNEQNYKCKICHSDIKYLSRTENKYKSACIDHCHVTGEVRGLLCSNCNRGLGLLKDDESIILRAYKYLVQYKSDKLLEKPEEVNQQPIISLND